MDRPRRNDAVNAGFGDRLIAREQDFAQALPGPDADVRDFDVTARLQPGNSSGAMGRNWYSAIPRVYLCGWPSSIVLRISSTFWLRRSTA